MVVSSALLYIAAVCLILPCWKKFSGGPVLGWVFVRLVAGPDIGSCWVVGLILMLLEFKRCIENFVGVLLDSPFNCKIVSK
jgi:hypothetical protein